MANFDQLKQSVAALIRTNGAEEITGQIMQDVLLTIINSISGGYMFGGVAQHSGNVGNPDYNVFYLAGSGAYTGYGDAINIPDGCYGVFRYNGSWTQDVVDIGVHLTGTIREGETNGVTGDVINTALQQLFNNIMNILDTLTFMYNTPSGQQATKAMLDVIVTPTGGASHVLTTLTLVSATAAAAGLMSAEDKRKVDRMLTDFRSLSFSDTTAVADQATKIVQTLSATLGENPEAITTMTFLAATVSKAGLLSAADKAKLDALWSSGYQFVGIATPSTTPISTTSKIFYIATEAGIYFNAVTVTQGINIIYKSGDAWSVAQVVGIDNEPTAGSDRLVKSGGVFGELALGAVYDVSAKNPTAGPNSDGKWESLSALLSDANLNTLIPTSVRKGGMSIKYVQSSDNKYVQYRLMANEFSTNVADWQGVDSEPVAGSKSLVQSGGVAKRDELPYFNMRFLGIGDSTDIASQNIYLQPNKVYKLSLSRTNWNISSITAGKVILSIGYLDANNVEHNIYYFFTSGQGNIPESFVINTNYYNGFSCLYIGFRGDVNEEIRVKIEDITDTFVYRKIQVTQGTGITASDSFMDCPAVIDNALKVHCVVKSECLSSVTVGYLVKGNNTPVVAVNKTNEFGKVLTFTIPAGTVLNGFSLYASSSSVTSTGSVEFACIIDYADSLVVDALCNYVGQIENALAQVNDKIRDSYVFKKTINTTANTSISSSVSTVDCNIKAGSVFSVIVVDKGNMLYATNTNHLLYAINYKDGTSLSALEYVPNVMEYRIAEKDISSVYIYAHKNAVVGTGQIVLRVAECKNMSSIDYASIIKTNFRNVSILGDSWSTYYKWIPSGNDTWYAVGGVDGVNAESNSLNDVKQTWWWMFSNETLVNMLIDESLSGSFVATYPKNYTIRIPFIPRMKRSIGEERTLESKPDLIIIEGGTNDGNSSGCETGDVMYSGWTDEDLGKTIPAFCYILDYLKKWNPGAVIVNIVNPFIGENTGKTDIITKMKTACEHYSVMNLKMMFIGRENGHPNPAGMLQIKNQLIGYLNAALSGVFDE